MVVPVLRAMSRSRRYAIVGADGLEESLSTTVLSKLPKIRSAIVPVPVRAAALGHRVYDAERWRRPRWSAFRPRHPLPSGAFWRMVVLLDHPSCSNRHVDHRHYTAECRPCLHRRQLRHRCLQFAVSLSLLSTFIRFLSFELDRTDDYVFTEISTYENVQFVKVRICVNTITIVASWTNYATLAPPM